MSKAITEVKLCYDLKRLPTVQHRAGLGGLAFLLESLHSDGVLPEETYALQDEKLELRLSKDILSKVLGYLYAGIEVTRLMNSKPKGEDFEEVELPTADGKTVKKFAYKDRRPAGSWLSRCGYGEEWLALWQDGIWSTLRDKPASREIYKAPVEELANKLWKAFEAVEKGKTVALDLASALYIGGRAKSNEDVSFDGMPAHVFLLHFAHALAQPFKVIGLNSLGDRTYPGLVWVYPEPRDLRYFIRNMREYLGTRTESDEEGTSRTRFYSSTRVTMPAEAGLVVLEMALSATKTEAISGAFCAQLDKQGNNVNLLAVAHIPADRKLIRRYSEEVAPISNYALKKMVLANLLKGAPLYRGAAKLMSVLPASSVLSLGKDGQAFSFNSLHLLNHLGE